MTDTTNNVLATKPTFDIEGMLEAKANSVTPAETFKETGIDGALQAGADNIYTRIDEERNAFFAWNDGRPLDKDAFERLHCAYKPGNLGYGISKFGLGTKTFASLGPLRVVISRSPCGAVWLGGWPLSTADAPVGLYSPKGLSDEQRATLASYDLEWVWEEFAEATERGVCWAIPLHAKGDKNEKVLSTYGSISGFYKDLKTKGDWAYSYYLANAGAAAPTITYAWRNGQGEDQEYQVKPYDIASAAVKGTAYKKEYICGGLVIVESFLVKDERIPGPVVLREEVAICNVPWERWSKRTRGRKLISNSKRDPYDRRHMYSRVFFPASYDDAVSLNETKTSVELDMAIKETLATHHDMLYNAAKKLREKNAAQGANATKKAKGANGIKTEPTAPPSHQGMAFSLGSGGMKFYEDSALYNVFTTLPANSRYTITELFAAIEECYARLPLKSKMSFVLAFHEIARTMERKILAHDKLSKIK